MNGLSGDSGATHSTMKTVWRAWILSRLWVALWVYAGQWGHAMSGPVRGGWAGVRNAWLNPWTGYDAQFYLRLAQQGYQPATTPFFPLYPGLLQPLAANPVAAALWGVLLSNGFLLGGLWALFELTRRDWDEATARRAVWLTAFFPTAAIWSSVYTESLFLLLICGTFLALRRERPLWCAALGFAAGLTRNAGPLLALALMLEAWRARRDGREWRPAALCSLAPLAGFLWVQLTLRARFGGLGATGAQALYGRIWTPPWVPLARDIAALGTPAGFNHVALLNVAAVVSVPLLLWVFRKRVPASYALLLGGVVVMNLALSHSTPPFTNSTLRFLSSCFPFAQLLAACAAPLCANRARLATALLILLGVCALFCLGVGGKQFVAG